MCIYVPDIQVERVYVSGTYSRGSDNVLHDGHELGRQDLGMDIRGTVLHDRVQDTQHVVHNTPIVVHQLTPKLLHCTLHPEGRGALIRIEALVHLLGSTIGYKYMY